MTEVYGALVRNRRSNVTEKKSKQYLRRKQLAARYTTTEWTIDRMVKDGRLPPPDLRNPFPLWEEANIEKVERTTLTTRAAR
jgi:hypothetical protein